MHYEDRIIAYLDVLGFRELIDGTVDADGREDAARIARINEAYKIIEANWAHETGAGARSKRVTIFSDTIVVSVRASEKSQIFLTLLEIKHLIMSLLERSILVRGAIVRGRLVHEGVKIFGPALIEAHNLETRAALYPRVILDQELVEAAADAAATQHSADDELGYVRSLLEQDSDGMFYIDYFYKAFSELDDPIYYPGYINKLGNIIRTGLKSFTKPSNSHIRIKYTWMRERYNSMVQTVRTGLKRRDWENEEPDELEVFYSRLKPIRGGRK